MFDENRYYKSVRLVSKDVSDVRASNGHQQYSEDLFTGRISSTITTLRPLHVGTGLLVPPSEVNIESDVPLLKSFTRVDDQLIVPGSSLKGSIRSIVETITHSCVNKTRYRWQRDEKPHHEECKYRSQRRQGKLCVACLMFGAMGFEGKIYFSDAPHLSGETDVHFIPAQYQPKGDSERRHYPHDLQDRRNPQWPLEVALPGSQFRLQLQFQNLEQAELGLLLIALGCGQPPLCLKIGAGKNSGLGAIRFSEHHVERLDTTALYTAFESSTAYTPVEIEDCLAKATRLLRTDDALGRLQADLGCDFFDR